MGWSRWGGVGPGVRFGVPADRWLPPAVALPPQPTPSETSGGVDPTSPAGKSAAAPTLRETALRSPCRGGKAGRAQNACAVASGRETSSSLTAANIHLPPPGETRFSRNEIFVSTSPALQPPAVARILRRHRLTETKAETLALTGESLRLWQISDGRAVAAVIQEFAGVSLVSAQPNYFYSLQDDAQPLAAPPLDDYWLAKLDVGPDLDVAAADPVRVAVIDTAIDETHPDLMGAVEARFDAIADGKPPQTIAHGTSIAGAIAGRGRLKDFPTARILSARAFDNGESGEPVARTFAIARAINWAWLSGRESST